MDTSQKSVLLSARFSSKEILKSEIIRKQRKKINKRNRFDCFSYRMSSKIKSQYKRSVFAAVCTIFLLMIFSADSPLDLGHDLMSLMTCQKTNFFALFQAVYYIPNMIIPLISGFIIDYIGLTYVLVCISCFGIIGQLYMFFFVFHECMSFEYLFVGRILYCISCETVCVSVFSYISMWFQGLKIGEYVGLLVGLNGVESLIFTALSANLFKNHEAFDLTDKQSIRYRYKWLFGMNLLLGIIIVLLAIYLFKVDRIVENSENNNVPVLKQHPDKLLGFWRSLKKSLRQNFLLICLVFAFMYSSFQSLHSNIHQILTLTLWGSQPYCNSRNTSSLNDIYETIHRFSVILTMISDTIIMLVPFFVGKFLIQKKRRYITTLFGCVAMIFSIGIVLSLLKNNCADSSIKIGFFIVSLFLCDFGFSCQYGLLYASVALMTKQNLIGTRFGIIHAIKNLIYFLFMRLEGSGLDISASMSNEEINDSIYNFKSVFKKTFTLLTIQLLLYVLIIYRMDEREKGKADGMSSTNLDELSTFIKK